MIGKGSVLPEEIKNIAIPYFENDTGNYELGQRLSEEVSARFSRQYEVTSRAENSDAVLQGVIKSYETKAVSFDAQSRVTKIEIVVVASVELINLKTNEVVWKSDNFVFREEYESQTNLDEYYNKEIEAIENLAEDFADSLYASITQGF